MPTEEWHEVTREVNRAIVDTSLIVGSLLKVIVSLVVFPVIGLTAAFVWFISLGYCRKALMLFVYSFCRTISTLMIADITSSDIKDVTKEEKV